MIFKKKNNSRLISKYGDTNNSNQRPYGPGPSNFPDLFSNVPHSLQQPHAMPQQNYRYHSENDYHENNMNDVYNNPLPNNLPMNNNSNGYGRMNNLNNNNNNPYYRQQPFNNQPQPYPNNNPYQYQYGRQQQPQQNLNRTRNVALELQRLKNNINTMITDFENTIDRDIYSDPSGQSNFSNTRIQPQNPNFRNNLNNRFDSMQNFTESYQPQPQSNYGNINNGGPRRFGSNSYNNMPNNNPSGPRITSKKENIMKLLEEIKTLEMELDK